MKIVAEMPASRAAHATAWPWLPALAATTPAAPLRLAERRDRVVRAADLERARPLEVLRLEEHLAARRAARTSRSGRAASRARRLQAARARPRCQRSSAASWSTRSTRRNTSSMISRTALSGSSSRRSTALEHALQLRVARRPPPGDGASRGSTRPRTPRRARLLAAALLEPAVARERGAVLLERRPQLGDVLAAQRLGEQDRAAGARAPRARRSSAPRSASSSRPA